MYSLSDKILIVEDQKDIGILIQTFLSSRGYTCDLVYNGREAVRKVVDENEKYDLCFMDIDMPVMNGCQATKAIRLQAEYFPIIAVTGDIFFEDKYAECGMDAIIKKPFLFEELIAAINKFLLVNDGSSYHCIR